MYCQFFRLIVVLSLRRELGADNIQPQTKIGLELLEGHLMLSGAPDLLIRT